MENSLNELKKYVVQGSVNEELIREQEQGYKPKGKVENPKPPQGGTGEVMREDRLTYAVRKVLAEALLGEQEPMADGPYNPEANVDPKVKKSQALVRVVQDALWKMRDSQRTPYNGEDTDEDIAKMMSNMNEPIIKMAVAKLYDIWYREKEKPDIEASVKIVDVVPGDEIVSPQGVEYKVESVANGKVSLVESGTGKKASADLSAVKKWKK
jgi:hypothetical protein